MIESRKLNEVMNKAGAHVITVEEPEAEENFSVIHNMIPFNFHGILSCTETGYKGNICGWR